MPIATSSARELWRFGSDLDRCWSFVADTISIVSCRDLMSNMSNTPLSRSVEVMPDTCSYVLGIYESLP